MPDARSDIPVKFTAHNIRLDNGEQTKPDMGLCMDAYPSFVSARRILDVVFPGDKSRLRLADLGCLEGGYAVEFARMGFHVIGLEVREANMAACRYVKARTNLPHLEFIQDDAWNLAQYGAFDAVFCCGLLYHLDHPRRFLELMSNVTKRLLILQTHFSTEQPNWKHRLSRVVNHEGLQGRWYTEFANDREFSNRASMKWAAWENRRSFWIGREYLLQAIRDVGFDLVLEQYDGLGPEIAESMTRGYYKTEERGTFVGIKVNTET